jgi:hypothetical protein
MHDDQMSRGEMIRRLDEAARTAAEELANGPLTAEEQHAIAASLGKLLPLVADSLQVQLDTETAAALSRDLEKPTSHTAGKPDPAREISGQPATADS